MNATLQIILESLGESLIAERKNAGLTQKGLAELLGVKEQQIQRYEATKYQSASLARLVEVIAAINSASNS